MIYLMILRKVYKKGEKVRIFSATLPLHTFMDG
mgnify:FL=1